jgi:capsid protein
MGKSFNLQKDSHARRMDIPKQCSGASLFSPVLVSVKELKSVVWCSVVLKILQFLGN